MTSKTEQIRKEFEAYWALHSGPGTGNVSPSQAIFMWFLSKLSEVEKEARTAKGILYDWKNAPTIEPGIEYVTMKVEDFEAAKKAAREEVIEAVEQRYKDSLAPQNNPLVDYLRSKFLETPNPQSMTSKKTPDSKCPRCKGNGRIEMLEHCPVCKGSGSKPYPDHFCANNDGEQNCKCFAEGVEFGRATGSTCEKPVSESKPWDWMKELEVLGEENYWDWNGDNATLVGFVARVAQHAREEGKKEGIQYSAEALLKLADNLSKDVGGEGPYKVAAYFVKSLNNES